MEAWKTKFDFFFVFRFYNYNYNDTRQHWLFGGVYGWLGFDRKRNGTLFSLW